MFINYYSACALKFNYQKKACHIPINCGAGAVLTQRRGTEHASARGQSCSAPRVVPDSKLEAFWELISGFMLPQPIFEKCALSKWNRDSLYQSGKTNQNHGSR